jgi:hypothetical protein
VPFVRVSRDKRGYELISLFHAYSSKGRAVKPRLLYAFRTPPGVKVGREPFDDSVKRELEAQNPDVFFDWVKLSNIPAPAPDVEYWRERRRVEKAAKLARRAEESAEAAESPDEPLEPGEEPSEELDDEPSDAELSAANPESVPDLEPVIEAVAEIGNIESESGQGAAEGPTGIIAPHRKRRRRGGRRRRRGRGRGEGAEAPLAAAPPDVPAERLPDSSKLPEDPPKEA